MLHLDHLLVYATRLFSIFTEKIYCVLMKFLLPVMMQKSSEPAARVWNRQRRCLNYQASFYKVHRPQNNGDHELYHVSLRPLQERG